MTQTILILGGSGEARDLAAAVAGRPGLRVISSLAGRTEAPRLPPGEVRVGGFGGALGLAAYLDAEKIDAVVDATHPFAARMGWNAWQGCAAARRPLLRLERPAWTPGAGDTWEDVADWDQAVGRLRQGSRRVLLALGRQELAPFAVLDDIWFLIRSVQAPDPMPPFAQAQVMLARGPFDHRFELELLSAHAIDTLVCKNSGGPTDAKLAAARDLGLRVVMRRRPDRPATPTVFCTAAALEWLRHPGGVRF